MAKHEEKKGKDSLSVEILSADESVFMLPIGVLTDKCPQSVHVYRNFRASHIL